MRQNRILPAAVAAASLVGHGVIDSQGEDLGKIEEIMLDVNSGCVAYVVLSFGGFLGLGDQLFAIPWEALQLDPNRHVFILKVDREMLEKAPGFDKNSWPQIQDTDWLTSIYDYYGFEPYWR